MSGHVNSEAGGDRAPAVISMSACAISGCISGFFLRGDFLEAFLVLVMVVFAGVAGWWARGAK